MEALLKKELCHRKVGKTQKLLIKPANTYGVTILDVKFREKYQVESINLTAAAIAKELNSYNTFSIDPESITRFGDTPMKDDVPDATAKYIVPINENESGVFFLSSSFNPNTVQYAVETIKSVRKALNSAEKEVVLAPLCSGFMGELSYAFWFRHNTLSSSRIIGLLQRELIAPKVFKWLRNVSSDTAASRLSSGVLKSGFYDPLKKMADNPGLSRQMRHVADVSIARIDKGILEPTHVVQHSDFWLGNIIFSRRRKNQKNPYGFYVIDWGGACVEGYPFMDLIRFSMSARVRMGRARFEIAAHTKIMNCDPVDMYSYTLASLGHLGMNLDQFPEYRYHNLCESVFEYLRATGFKHA